jgi:hypothetical protein
LLRGQSFKIHDTKVFSDASERTGKSRITLHA